ncbi:hypothetical protein EVAR_21421_1 [Eumeta japonica]|uniref:Uncharacterized protein n=1 Tax=Eumeta variegata TaxID=151549 RepID=A0A4C1VG65_EUMVA|nr:hypothetical protein EVAR_21421_1 [Eumeta japonica]
MRVSDASAKPPAALSASTAVRLVIRRSFSHSNYQRVGFTLGSSRLIIRSPWAAIKVRSDKGLRLWVPSSSEFGFEIDIRNKIALGSKQEAKLDRRLLALKVRVDVINATREVRMGSKGGHGEGGVGSQIDVGPTYLLFVLGMNIPCRHILRR